MWGVPSYSPDCGALNAKSAAVGVMGASILLVSADSPSKNLFPVNSTLKVCLLPEGSPITAHAPSVPQESSAAVSSPSTYSLSPLILSSFSTDTGAGIPSSFSSALMLNFRLPLPAVFSSAGAIVRLASQPIAGISDALKPGKYTVPFSEGFIVQISGSSPMSSTAFSDIISNTERLLPSPLSWAQSSRLYQQPETSPSW